jgi:hypothetical protein
MFNGSPERYDWKIVGKREMYIPWNAFATNQADVKIEDLIKHKGHVNTDPMRFELQRVWVLEATLKPGFRHQYAKRVFYIQEDTWGSALSDQYDGRGQLWRTVLGNVGLRAADALLGHRRATRGLRVCTISASGACRCITSRQPRVSRRRRSRGV